MPGQDSQDPNHAEKPNHTENHNHGEDNRKTIAKAAALIMDGEILAVKGIGGYNFICSPFNKATVKTLRLIKKREEKPFAILFKDVEQIRTYCQVDENEARLLNSSARPILLLERNPHRDETKSPAIPSEVIRTSRFIGAFLPSTGLHYQLVSACGPLIATSANTSEAPMIKDDKEMRCKIEELQGRSWKIEGAENALLTGNQPEIRFGMLYNQREVRERLDDSVVRVIDNQPQMIRRAKGYAPVPLRIAGDQPDSGDRILATGGQLKASFCLTKGNFAYVSQFFGDLDQQQSCKIYDENVARLKTFFGIEPSLLVHDLHPLYYTTGFAEGYSKEFSRELIHGLLGVQHHHAHVASVMAEHDLVGPVLGVSFDGTGYGTDGAIWGGEFLICDAADFKRAAHLDYVSMLGGDASMKEGWKSAMCYGVAYGLAWPETDERYSLIKAGLEHQINTIRSTSMGRLFDAMASYLDIHHVNRYEGECAIMLENFAAEALKKGLSPYPMTFDIEEGGISARRIFEAADTGLKAGVSREALALGFHYAVADMILRVCSLIRDQEGINQIALTGGVFQNKIVMERSLKLLRSEAFSVYYNISVGPNDGGISLGQAYIGIQHLAQIRRKSCV
jgi:hydrogenase maturation protein HypF